MYLLDAAMANSSAAKNLILAVLWIDMMKRSEAVGREARFSVLTIISLCCERDVPVC
jgi:hypothetical protein